MESLPAWLPCVVLVSCTVLVTMGKVYLRRRSEGRSKGTLNQVVHGALHLTFRSPFGLRPSLKYLFPMAILSVVNLIASALSFTILAVMVLSAFQWAKRSFDVPAPDGIILFFAVCCSFLHPSMAEVVAHHVGVYYAAAEKDPSKERPTGAIRRWFGRILAFVAEVERGLLNEVCDELKALSSHCELKLATDVVKLYSTDELRLMGAACDGFSSDTMPASQLSTSDEQRYRLVIDLIRRLRTRTAAEFKVHAVQLLATMPGSNAERIYVLPFGQVLEKCGFGCECCLHWSAELPGKGKCAKGHTRNGDSKVRAPWNRFFCPDHACQEATALDGVHSAAIAKIKPAKR